MICPPPENVTNYTLLSIRSYYAFGVRKPTIRIAPDIFKHEPVGKALCVLLDVQAAGLHHLEKLFELGNRVRSNVGGQDDRERAALIRRGDRTLTT